LLAVGRDEYFSGGDDKNNSPSPNNVKTKGFFDEKTYAMLVGHYMPLLIK